MNAATVAFWATAAAAVTAWWQRIGRPTPKDYQDMTLAELLDDAHRYPQLDSESAAMWGELDNPPQAPPRRYPSEAEWDRSRPYNHETDGL